MKKGISLVSLIVVIIVMIILAGIVVATGFDSAENATINTFALELLNIQTAVDDYHYKYEKYPSISEYTLDTTTIQSESLAQFDGETITDNKITLKLLNMSLIGITDTEFGNGKDKDIYLLSETTGKVYYLKGIAYKGVTYYTLTTELTDILDITSNLNVSTNDVKIYDVIFSPSEVNYTNLPVIVQVKLPTTAVINSITVPEGKSVSEETIIGMYKVVTVNETTEDKNGNYTITVSYEYEGLAKIAEYSVTNFDNVAPTLTVSETESGNIKTISVSVTETVSGVEKIRYSKEIIADKEYFKNYGIEIKNNQFKIESDSYYTVYVEDKAGNSTIYNNMKDEWKANVVDIVDKVPIPKGFTASPYAGENTKNGGLVIYELNENESSIPRSETQYESWTKRNQYVWVPVPKEDFVTKFVRQNFTGKDPISNEVGSMSLWEVALDTDTNMPLTEQNETYITPETLAEVQAMYASVKEYEGFFVARYEAGINIKRTGNAVALLGSNVHSKMNKIPYTYVQWSRVVESARSVYKTTDENYGVVSTTIYGVQWDTILQWFLDTKGITSVTDSISYGNYMEHIITSNDELNAGALVYDSINGTDDYVAKEDESITYPKEQETGWLLSTGALKAAKVNNIYDMAGNVWEWTMEGINTNTYAMRGGYGNGVEEGGIALRNGIHPLNPNTDKGFRIALYIKK